MELFKRFNKKSPYDADGEIWFSLFDQYVDFSIDDDADLAYAKHCAGFINELTEQAIKDLCEASIRYCNNFLDMLGERTKEFSHYRDVLPMIRPAGFIIPNKESYDPIIHLELRCDWEPEHGKEWVVRAGELMYVGAFNGRTHGMKI